MASTSKSPETLISDVGNWVDGDRFWGREADIQALLELIQNGANIAISAPRRIGKTSLMREVARRSKGAYLSIHVDLQRALTVEDVVVELAVACQEHRELGKRVLEILRVALSSVEQLQLNDLAVHIRSVITNDWRSKADRLIDEFVDHEPPVVIYLDELAILVNRLLKGNDHTITSAGIKEVDALMSWLRHTTIRHARKIRFVVASSIGLVPILSQARLSATLNTFTPFGLAPWDAPTTRGALVALANHVKVEWADDGPDAVIQRLGACIPHHVQVFWRALREDARQRGVPRVTADDVERVFRTELLGSREHSELDHYEERLLPMLGSRLLPLAIDLLSEAAIVGPLTIPALQRLAADYPGHQLREVLDVLLHDGYLHQGHDTYTFPSNYLREWWMIRHRPTHRTLAQRGFHG
jgi:hypothetical protein